jgi:phosphatidate cytidylyltransferase
MDANVVRRVGFAAVAIPVALAIVYVGGIPLTILAAVASLLGTRELYDLAAQKGIRALRGPGLVAATSMAPLTYAALTEPTVAEFVSAWWPFVLVTGVLVLLLWLLATRGPTDQPLAAIGVTMFGIAYSGVMPAFLLVIRHGGQGLDPRAATTLVFFPLVATWVCDTAAMFGGRAMQGPKMAPTISPGKTWSGTGSGGIGALIVVPVWQLVALEPAGVALPWTVALLIAGSIGVLGQLGDLTESLFKREAGVKDSSAIIPGHGGVLDRLDSLYFVLPVTALLYRAFGII